MLAHVVVAEFDALSGGVAVIRVGAATETEVNERKLRVDDALLQQVAVLQGGGVEAVRFQRAKSVNA